MTTNTKILTTATLLLTAAGCGSNPSRPARLDGTAFRPADEPRQIQLVMNAQTNAGARRDAMLHAADFDGARLNTLGQDHLDRMLDATSGSDPLVVYLDVTGGSSDDQKSAVAQYLKARGLTETQYRLQDGPNPAQLTSSEASIHAVRALNGEEQAGGPTGQPATSPGNAQPSYTAH